MPLIFCESQPHLHVHHRIDQNPMLFVCLLFVVVFPTEGKGTVKESESVMDTPQYFELNNQTNPMSVRGEPAATRFIIRNFTLPSP